ncbi:MULTISPECIES: hypothetical protein [unclassified Thioalkalivibrio]|uniref:hypothetical protein n=1 Tax=unclassified Thioalkalivibrio TaxID=2621013 RepID=UPI0012DE6AD8|nr:MULTISPECIES: hypothetical protein [unclassified Thioalkalivibrio]
MTRIVAELAQNIGVSPCLDNARIRNLRARSQLRRIDLTFPGNGVAGPRTAVLESIAFRPCATVPDLRHAAFAALPEGRERPPFIEVEAT